MDLRTNSDYFPIQHWLTGFYNWEGVCLLRGTDWVFKYNLVWFSSFKTCACDWRVSCSLWAALLIRIYEIATEGLVVCGCGTWSFSPCRGTSHRRRFLKDGGAEGRIGDWEEGGDSSLERELHNEVLRDILGSGGQWPVRRMGYRKSINCFVETSEGKTSVRRRRHGSEGDIKMNF